MAINVTKGIGGVGAPVVNLHDKETDDRPYLFVQIGEHGAAVSLWSEDPADFRRVADALLDGAERLEAAIEARRLHAEAVV